MKRINAIGMALVGLGIAGITLSGPSAADEALAWTPHPIYGQQRFEGCPAMAGSGIDQGLANALVSARSPGTRTGDVLNGIMSAAAPGHDAETRANSERVHFMPVSNVVCGADRQGRKVTFGRSFLGGAIRSMTVAGPRGSVTIALDDMGTGLDGERLVAMSSIDGGAPLDELVADSLPMCIATSAPEGEAVTAMVDSFGGVLGAVLGQRTEENEAFRGTCRSIARKLG